MASLIGKLNGDITCTTHPPYLSNHIIDISRITSAISKHLTEPLVQATPAQVIRYDDVSDSIEDKLDVVGVCSTGHVGVDLFAGRLVLALVLTLDVGDSL